MKLTRGGSDIARTVLLLIIICQIIFIGHYLSVSRYRNNNYLPLDANIVPIPPKTVVAVGDMACDPKDPYFNGANPTHCQSVKTHELLAKINPDTILALGDLQYENGSLDKFLESYDKNWGKDKSKTYAAAGNHEYVTPGATGYYDYFNDPSRTGQSDQGYYAFNVGQWHIIALNSNCAVVGGCQENSPQYTWLQRELFNDKSTCTLAFWHHPHFTSGRYAKDQNTKNLTSAFWNLLANKKVDVILNGHDHLYERFDLQAADGQVDPRGIRQFTVGTGGKVLYPLVNKEANSQKLIDDQFGVLILRLYGKSYKWQFQGVNGDTLDSGYQRCSPSS